MAFGALRQQKIALPDQKRRLLELGRLRILALRCLFEYRYRLLILLLLVEVETLLMELGEGRCDHQNPTGRDSEHIEKYRSRQKCLRNFVDGSFS